MRVGICGYPGSGKSTVFHALAPGAPSERAGVHYGNIKVPDDRVDRLARIFSPRKTTYAEITFVDVGGGPAGGRSTGAFSAGVVQHMRNADVLAHVVRAFPNPALPDPADPQRDVRLFNDELVLLDLGVLEKRLERFQKKARRGVDVDVTTRAVAHLEGGRPLRTLGLSEQELDTLTGIQLLSLQPLITLYNLSEEAWEDPAFAHLRTTRVVSDSEVATGLCGSIEAEIAELEGADQQEMLDGLGLGEPARHEFVRAAYRLLDLISFLTCGPDECRAWPVRRGTTARKAAGKVHSDIERGFIRAEIYRVEELEVAGSEAALKSQGKIRVEGKDYVVQDGDVVHFRFNV